MILECRLFCCCFLLQKIISYIEINIILTKNLQSSSGSFLIPKTNLSCLYVIYTCFLFVSFIIFFYPLTHRRNDITNHHDRYIYCFAFVKSWSHPTPKTISIIMFFYTPVWAFDAYKHEKCKRNERFYYLCRPLILIMEEKM